ncbi:protein GLUTAMINE DUMPER 5-like [Cicer arietinum]|uniref:Protein GLUTAMINE DUMPER 5-like n=1 Tax=Cicer arietinum TaxID=3827 RepID=A0A1S2XMV0_CICAR|nr:protein GLUTAMINE DUMPER 5-like [Cicer arietinum]
MGPSSTLSTNSTMSVSSKNLSSPIPYLFGGLAFMLGVIAIALFILACSFRKQHSSSTTSSDHEEKPSNMHVVDMDQVSLEPKIVVIMAGESNPTYLAEPVSSMYESSTIGI